MEKEGGGAVSRLERVLDSSCVIAGKLLNLSGPFAIIEAGGKWQSLSYLRRDSDSVLVDRAQ